MKIGAIVQARMGSTRLPGKVMKPIAGQPMFWHVVQRLRRSKFINEIIVASSTKKADQVILDLVQKRLAWLKPPKVRTFAGNEADVLDRYYQAAEKFGIDIVVRVTSDCPLIDPREVDKVIATYLRHKDSLDYVDQGEGYPLGCTASEVFSFKILERVWREAKSLYEREHVTPYIYWNPQLFRIKRIQYERGSVSYLKLSVDYEKDLKLIREIFRNLYFGGGLFHLEDVIRLLEYKPELLEEWENEKR